MAYSTPITKSTGDVVTASDWNTNTSDNMLAMRPHGANVQLDGGGAVVLAGRKAWLICPNKYDLSRVTLLGTPSGSITVDVRKCTYSQFDGGSTHPVSGDTIFTTKPAISSGTKYQDTTLSGVTKNWTEGDILEVYVDSATTITFGMLELKVLVA